MRIITGDSVFVAGFCDYMAWSGTFILNRLALAFSILVTLKKEWAIKVISYQK